MQLCSNAHMVDKVCTNDPMTDTGFWSPSQTATGAATRDTDALRPQVSICCVATLFTPVQGHKGSFHFQVVKLNYMEWYQPFVTAFSSNVVQSL